MGFDYVTVGHVTVDVLEDAPATAGSSVTADASGRRRPGGGAFYSALQAARLGLRTLIVTRGVPRELEELMAPYAAELEIEIARARQTTTLSTRGRGHDRVQRLLAWAGPFAETVTVDTAILHLAPIARETPRSWQGRADFVGLTPQGLVRAWDASGTVTTGPLDRAHLPSECDAIVFSASERASCAELLPPAEPRTTGTELGAEAQTQGGGMAAPAEAPGWNAASARANLAAAVVAVTAGAQPTTVLRAGHARIDAPPPAIARPCDDLGAGDVFAAAFFVALHEGRSAEEAAAFANAAAAVRIAGVGPRAIGDRRAIQARLSGA